MAFLYWEATFDLRFFIVFRLYWKGKTSIDGTEATTIWLVQSKTGGSLTTFSLQHLLTSYWKIRYNRSCLYKDHAILADSLTSIYFEFFLNAIFFLCIFCSKREDKRRGKRKKKKRRKKREVWLRSVKRKKNMTETRKRFRFEEN